MVVTTQCTNTGPHKVVQMRYIEYIINRMHYVNIAQDWIGKYLMSSRQSTDAARRIP